MVQPRIDSITYTMRRGSPPRRPKAGDEKMIRGVLHVRQQVKHGKASVVSNGRPVWEWVEWGGDRDRGSSVTRYRTDFLNKPIIAPDGWKILEAGRPVPKEHCRYEVDPATAGGQWHRNDPRFVGREAERAGLVRAFAIPKTNFEMTRDYFEDGCLCIGKLFKKRGPDIGAERAVKFYMSRCKCSRHPEYVHEAD